MITILFLFLNISPFYKADFLSQLGRSISIFSNPAGLGIQPGAELFFTYHHQPKTLTSGLELGNVGFGIKKIDSLLYFEVGVGYKLPGAVSFGYSYQFADTSNHIFGLLCRPSASFSIGCRTTLGEKKVMRGGFGIKPFIKYLTLCFDLEYEGIEDTLCYFYGGILGPMQGVRLQFYTDDDFNWHAGVELSSERINLAGSYSSVNKKLSGGVIFSAQRYPGN